LTVLIGVGGKTFLKRIQDGVSLKIKSNVQHHNTKAMSIICGEKARLLVFLTFSEKVKYKLKFLAVLT
jgi:hypothetical protein